MSAAKKHEPPQSADTPTVVVGVDGSDESKAALRWAVHYASTIGAHVKAVIAFHWPFSTAALVPGVGEYDPRRDALDVVSAAVAEVARDRAVEVSCHACPGAAVPVLLHEAEHANLLVVGHRGRGGFKGLLLGSTSELCVRHASCPVVVARSSVEADDAADARLG